MSTAMRNGISFVASLSDHVGIDTVAQEVGRALNVSLRESDERGLQDDFVGELAGLTLWLRITDPATREAPPRIALLGDPQHQLEEDAVWVDIGPYIADLLTERTGRTWTTGSS